MGRQLIRKLVIAFVVTTLTTIGPAGFADDPSGDPTVTPDDGGDGPGGFGTEGTEGNDEDGEDGDAGTENTSDADEPSTMPPGEWVRSNDACDTVGASGCIVGYTCADGAVPTVWVYVTAAGPYASTSLCPGEPPPTATPPTPPVDIPGEALTAFKKVGLPDSTINIQPPGGETLVNFKTIFSTGGARHQIPVHLDRVNIDLLLEVWPSSFTWKHGDGTTQTTAVAGSPWFKGADVDSADFVTHVYSKILKDVPVSVDTTWSAQFKVVGEPDWRPVNGTVTEEGAPLPLTVREATPELVTAPN